MAPSQTNGLTEATNKNILTAIKKKLEDAKGLWAEDLPKNLSALRTMPNSATQQTLFTLAFRQDAMAQ